GSGARHRRRPGAGSARMTRVPLVSLIVPVHNEEANLRRLYDAVNTVLRGVAGLEWEFVFVDDGSRDRSFGVIGDLHRADPRVLALRFPRNLGSHVAIAAGIDHCHGDAAIIIAADLQDPPELLPSFIASWRDGHDIVWGARAGRDDGALRAALMRSFYRLVRRVAGPAPPAGRPRRRCPLAPPGGAAVPPRH